ncbi:glycosyltransferase family 4 protein [Bradyrhizobium shewense]|uniref:glycosyltransferase family 4 protein n=1 Tax=Bradyrhizobium shewense TaxID=1761772 RepID=UPI0013F5BBBD|nr:glycosyltransferase family 4 protein [Bradyrhizobium shewense]
MISTDVRLTYIGFSGGSRQLVDLLAIFIARVRNRQIMIHHHSFAYINERKVLTAIITKIAGQAAIHVVLCSCMAQKLRTLYSDARQVICLSNLALMEATGSVNLHARGLERTGLLRSVGYLSNITVEKGFLTFIEVVEKLHKSCPNIRAIIAGPFSDNESREAFELALNRGVPLEYRGPVYGEAKEEFFSAIDILLFPTRYVNEAEPIVILESVTQGVPVVASARGCISEMLPNGAGRVVSEDAWLGIHKWLFELATAPSKMDDLRLTTRQSAVLMVDASRFQREQWLSYLTA